MSEALTINGKKLLPIKEVVGRTKYTRDYVAKLAREGQIVGAQVGRQWFIDEQSLTNFAEASELEAEVRNRHLSRDRRRERETKEVVKKQWDVIVAHPRYSARKGLAQSVLVVMIGMVAGYAVYATPEILVHTASFQNAQSPLAGEIAAIDTTVPTITELPVSSVVHERATFTDTFETRRLEGSEQGILLVPTTGTATTAEDIARLFSDPVVVSYAADGEGIVSLSGGEVASSASSVPFVTVPFRVAKKSEEVVVGYDVEIP